MNRRFFINQSLLFLGAVACNQVFAGETANGETFLIKQFEDTGLAHFSYAILVKDKIVLIDPARNPQPYYDFASANNAKIVSIIETHLHADFVSSHLEISQFKKAKVYASKLANAHYKHHNFDEGDLISLSADIKLKAINTPGHSPDSISIILQDRGKDIAVFSGDSLLFGSVGRPDLREYSGELATEREKLAAQMYDTIHHKFAKLGNDVLVYPAHGAGSLCGSSIRNVKESTIGYERAHNFAFQNVPKEQFVATLLKDQPHIPQYFPYDVELNRKGAEVVSKSLLAIPFLKLTAYNFKPEEVIVDIRTPALFASSHFPGSINIAESSKFETWLGTIIKPEQKIYLIANSESELKTGFTKASKIGYDSFIKGGFVYENYAGESFKEFDKDKFLSAKSDYFILDVRTAKEASEDKIFSGAVNIPLAELQEEIKNLPKDKPVIVHCASGFRSAIGISIIKSLAPNIEVYDIGGEIGKYR